MHVFGTLVHIFGKLAHILEKLVHILARKLGSRTSKQVSRNLGPLWQPGVYNDTRTTFIVWGTNFAIAHTHVSYTTLIVEELIV